MTSSKACWKHVSAIVLLVPAFYTSPADAQDTRLLKQFKTAGKDASLTVLPVRLGDSPMKQVGEAVGLLLERAGMKNVEIGSDEFLPPDQADLSETGKALAKFVKAHPSKTNYTLFADFQVSAQRKFVEVRGVIVDKKGGIVWQDRQTGDDADFKRINPNEPLLCCILLVERLRPVLSLDDPTRESTPEGKLAERWRKQSGTPDKVELAALKEREQAFKKAAPKATLLIYPPRAGEEMSKVSATHLAALINEAKLAKAASADQGPRIKVKRAMNEQKTLWEMARTFREQVQKQPPDADYVLFADYLMGKNAVGAVHFALCDRHGELVVVDFQNSHHDDFKAIKPKSREDCDQLVVKRLKAYCR